MVHDARRKEVAWSSRILLASIIRPCDLNFFAETRVSVLYLYSWRGERQAKPRAPRYPYDLSAAKGVELPKENERSQTRRSLRRLQSPFSACVSATPLQALELFQDLLAVGGGDGGFGEVGEDEAEFVLGEVVGAGDEGVDLGAQVVAAGVA